MKINFLSHHGNPVFIFLQRSSGSMSLLPPSFNLFRNVSNIRRYILRCLHVYRFSFGGGRCCVPLKYLNIASPDLTGNHHTRARVCACLCTGVVVEGGCRRSTPFKWSSTDKVAIHYPRNSLRYLIKVKKTRKARGGGGTPKVNLSLTQVLGEMKGGWRKKERNEIPRGGGVG